MSIYFKKTDITPDMGTIDVSSILAHEIKSPLSRMEFELEHIRALTTNNVVIQSVENLMSDINDIEELTNDILSHTDYSINTAKLNVTKINGNDFVNKLVLSFERPSTYEVRLSKDANKSIISINQQSVSRAIKNLFTNAIKYGHSQVMISTAIEKGEFHIIIEDDGLGIPTHFREKVFNIFFRLDNNITNKAKGFGLGLPIAKSIIEKHGGKISIEDSVLGGAKFIIRLPLNYISEN